MSYRSWRRSTSNSGLRKRLIDRQIDRQIGRQIDRQIDRIFFKITIKKTELMMTKVLNLAQLPYETSKNNLQQKDQMKREGGGRKKEREGEGERESHEE